jgi:hypothetical protein
MMALLCLLSELLLLVLTHLEAESDINSLVRTNKQLYAVPSFYLYERNSRNSGSAMIWACKRGSEATVWRAIEGRTKVQTTDRPCVGPAMKLILEMGLVDIKTEEGGWRTIDWHPLGGYETVARFLLGIE